MISELTGRITQKQIYSIAKRIKNRYRGYIAFSNAPIFKAFFLSEYAPHRKKHNISWAIYGAFPSNRKIFRFVVKPKKDKAGYIRPELSNKKVVFHILSSTCDFKADYLNEYYLMNRNNFQNKKIYFYFRFSIMDNNIIIVEICLPDENGRVIKREVL